jgi:fatty-acid desaturase
MTRPAACRLAIGRPMLMFAITLGIALTLVPWYGIAHGYTLAAWVAFAVLLSVTELSITCGYHRLFSHAAYQAHPGPESESFFYSVPWLCRIVP